MKPIVIFHCMQLRLTGRLNHKTFPAFSTILPVLKSIHDG